MSDHFISKFKELFFNSDELDITGTTKFKELAEWDSLAALSLIALMDSEFGVKLTGEALKTISSVEEIYLLINE